MPAAHPQTCHLLQHTVTLLAGCPTSEIGAADPADRLGHRGKLGFDNRLQGETMLCSQAASTRTPFLRRTFT